MNNILSILMLIGLIMTLFGACGTGTPNKFHKYANWPFQCWFTGVLLMLISAFIEYILY